MNACVRIFARATIFIVALAVGLGILTGCGQRAATEGIRPTPTASSSTTGSTTTSTSKTTSASTFTPMPTPTATIASVRSTPIGSQSSTTDSAVVTIDSSGAWHPSNVGIRPEGSVIWENYDTTSAHDVECIQSNSSATCPWQGSLHLGPAYLDASGNTIPSKASMIFQNPGIFVYRDALHPTAQGQVIVGAPG